MAVTMQAVIDQARGDLNDSHTDDAKRRYPDAKLLKFANEGLLESKVWRPDLWTLTYFDAWTDLTAGQNFPLPDQYRAALAHYIVYRAERKDDEYVTNERAASALKLCLVGFGVS